MEPGGSGGREASGAGANLRAKPGAWVELALTLPIFLGYHVGVVFLKTQNATDIVTGPLLGLAHGDRAAYVGITAAIGLVFATTFAILGRGQIFRVGKFVQMALEGAVYAALMGTAASYIVGRIFAGRAPGEGDPFSGIVMSLGAGFYEELAFRVVLFGLGAQVLAWLFAGYRPGLLGRSSGRLTVKAFLIMLAWGIAAACIFSGVHYVGELGDRFALSTFVFRLVLGLALTLIYVVRGFAAAVWAHALYDIWVLVFAG
jgi:hypothetical protein